jgi:folate-binding protein YgfZ
MSSPILLDHRSVLIVSGADAGAFLQGLVTVSSMDMAQGEMRYGALLTPQGRVIADMILERSDDGFLMDCDRGVAPALAKRLNMFRLRAAVAISDRSDLGVIAFDGAADPRSAEAPRRKIAPRSSAALHDPGRYHSARIAAGLPEQGADFGSEEVFPADINMDLVGGIDFRKGCFVGQEVVSRMKRRGTARRRTLRATLAADTPAPSPVLAGGFEIGTLTSVAGNTGLARIRIDRLAEAQAKGEPLTAGGAAASFDNPPWLAEELAALAEARASRR